MVELLKSKVITTNSSLYSSLITCAQVEWKLETLCELQGIKQRDDEGKISHSSD